MQMFQMIQMIQMIQMNQMIQVLDRRILPVEPPAELPFVFVGLNFVYHPYEQFLSCIIHEIKIQTVRLIEGVYSKNSTFGYIFLPNSSVSLYIFLPNIFYIR